MLVHSGKLLQPAGVRKKTVKKENLVPTSQKLLNYCRLFQIARLSEGMVKIYI